MMAARPFVYALCAMSCSLSTATFSQSIGSSDPPSPSPQTQQPAPSGMRIYGGQLMTPAERAAYMKKVRAAKTPEERQKLETEHSNEIRARAKEKSVAAPAGMPGR